MGYGWILKEIIFRNKIGKKNGFDIKFLKTLPNFILIRNLAKRFIPTNYQPSIKKLILKLNYKRFNEAQVTQDWT